MKRNLARHEKEEDKVGFKFEQWQSAKLRNLEKYRNENKAIISKYENKINNSIILNIISTYRKAQDSVSRFVKRIRHKYVEDVFVKFPGDLEPILTPSDNKELEPIKQTIERVIQNAKTWQEAPRPLDDVFFRGNDRKFNTLLEAVENDFKNANAAVLRRMDDVYRQTIFKAQVYYNQGAVSLDKAIDMATENFLAKGIDAITYKDGKKVNIASYAEMALRTANHRAYLMGEGKKRQEIGLTLVVVSAHATSCKLCVPWQGLILIDDVYSGGKKEDGPYPLLSEAMEKGFLHPNCRHNLSTYFPGITTLPNVPDAKEVLRNYEQEQRQRALERAIREQKRKVAGTIDSENLKAEKKKLNELQQEMRNHLEENPQLRRAYRREKPGPGISNEDLKTHEISIIRDSYKEIQGITTSNGITIEYISEHFIDRSIERKVTAEEIKNALTNPLNIGKIKYNKDNKPSVEYTGEFARVQVNPDTGKLATVWRTSSKLRNKYMGDKNGKN